MRHWIASHEEWTEARRTPLSDRGGAETISGESRALVSDAERLQARRVATADNLLSFAAAPTFAVMALVTVTHVGGMPDMLCSAHGSGLPLNGMALMYALMSAFHLGPWLNLISQGRRALQLSNGP